MKIHHKLVPTNWVQWLTYLTAAAVAILMPIILFRIQDVQHHQNDALHSIICQVESVQKHSPLLTAQQRRQDIRFWDKALSDARLASCDS